MADTAIDDLTALTTLAKDDVFPVVDQTDDTTKKATWLTLLESIGYYRVDASETDQGVTGDGKTIKAFVDSIGATKKAVIFLPHDGGGNTTTYTLTTSETIPDNIELVIQNGAVIDGAGTLSIDCNVVANKNQTIFGSSITIEMGAAVGDIYAEWFGDIDGTADDVQIQAALDALDAGSITGTVKLLSKEYVIDSTVTIPEGLRLEGPYDMFVNDVNGCLLTCNVSGAACVQTGDGTTNSSGSEIKNIRISAGSSTDGIGIYIYYGYSNRVTNCRCDGFVTGTGMKVAGGTSGSKPTIQTTVRDLYLANNLVNLHLTGNDDDDDSSSDEGLYSNVRIAHSELANSKGVYIEKGYSNEFHRLSVTDASVTAGTVGIKFDDGARSVSYAARHNNFYGLNIEQITTPFQTDANCWGNLVFGAHIYHPSLTAINDDSSGGGGLIIRYMGTPDNLARFDFGNTGNTPINLLYNGEFERWENSTSAAPTGWTLSGAGASVARSASERKGTYSAAVTRGGADTILYQSVSDYEHLKGRWVSASVWAYATVASRVDFTVYDGVGSTPSVLHTGGSTWELLTVRHKVDSSATGVSMYLQILNGDTTGIFDQATLIEGYEVPLPHGTPLLDEKRLYNTTTWNPGNLADGAGETKSLTVNGAAFGDFVLVSAPYDLQDMTCTGYVQAANTVEIRLQNESGGAIDLASGTWAVMVFKY